MRTLFDVTWAWVCTCVACRLCYMYVRAHGDVSGLPLLSARFVRKMFLAASCPKFYLSRGRPSYSSKNHPRVTFLILILSLPFNASQHTFACTLLFILSSSHSLFPVCIQAACLTDPSDLTWHKQQSLCKKGTIFVKRNCLARDI